MIHRQRLIPALVGVLLLVAQLACGQAPTALPAASSTPIVDVALPPILYIPFAGTEPQLISVTAGTIVPWQPSQVGSVSSVLAQPHQVIDRRLVSEAANYFMLPTGVPSPDGQWLIYGENTTNGTQIDGSNGALYLRRVDGSGERLITNAGHSPRWAPDSSGFTYQAGSDLHIFILATDETHLVSEAENLVAWAADGQQLLYCQANRVFRLRFADGELEQIPRLDGRQLHGWPIWSADGRTLYAFYGQDRNLEIARQRHSLAPLVAIDLTSGAQRTLLPAQRAAGALDFALSPDSDFLAVWYAACRMRLNAFLPIPERACSHDLLLVATDGSGWRKIVQLSPETASFFPPIFAWQQWQAPLTLAELPVASTAATQTGVEALPLPDEPGLHPLNPSPFRQTRTGSYRSYRVNQVLVGEEAWAYGEAALTTPALLAPAPGYTYVTVLLDVAVTSGQARIGPSTLKLIDEQWAAHTPVMIVEGNGRAPEFNQAVVRALDGTVTLGIVFLLASARTPTLLFAHGGPGESIHHYLALSSEANLPDRPSAPQPSNQLGLSEPIAVGHPAIGEEWQVMVTRVYTGADLTMLGIEQFFPDLETAIAAQIQVQYTGNEQPFRCVLANDFVGLAETQVLLPPYRLVLPVPLQAPCLLAGGQTEHWLLLTAPNLAEAGFAFDPGGDRFGQRYFALTSAGQQFSEQ